MDDKDLMHNDAALDRALGGLAPPSAPVTSPSDILAYGAAAGAASVAAGTAAGLAPAVAKGLSLWKAAVLVVAGISVGVAGERIYQRATSTFVDDVEPPGVAVENTVEPVLEGGEKITIANEALPPSLDCPPIVPPAPAAGPETKIAQADEVEQEEGIDLDWLDEEIDNSFPEWEDDDNGPEEPRQVEPIDKREQVVEVKVEKPEIGPVTPAEVWGRLEGGLMMAGGMRYGPFGVPGPLLRFGGVVLGPTRGLGRGLLVADLDLMFLPTQQGPALSFAGGLVGGAGFALDGPKTRFEFNWTGGVRLTPPASSGLYSSANGARKVYGVTGPQLGLVFKGKKGVRGRAGVTFQGSYGDPDGDGQYEFLPWLGFMGGIEFGARRPG